MKISAHIILKNEIRFAWYSIMSVLKYVSYVHIWDTGSSDGTTKIIEEIGKFKDDIDFRKIETSKFDEAEIRGKMLKADNADWILVLDADEIWWEDSIKKVIDVIKSEGNKLESIVVPTFNVVGDMFHYQEKEAGRYNLVGKVGHYGLRAINKKIPGLSTNGGHGIFAWVDGEGVRIEKRDPKKIKFLDAPYIHATHLKRSSGIGSDINVYKRYGKLKYENGIPFPIDFYYPEVFFRARPDFVPSPWDTPGFFYKIRAFIESPLKQFYRRTLLPFKKHGY